MSDTLNPLNGESFKTEFLSTLQAAANQQITKWLVFQSIAHRVGGGFTVRIVDEQSVPSGHFVHDGYALNHAGNTTRHCFQDAPAKGFLAARMHKHASVAEKNGHLVIGDPAEYFDLRLSTTALCNLKSFFFRVTPSTTADHHHGCAFPYC